MAGPVYNNAPPPTPLETDLEGDGDTANLDQIAQAEEAKTKPAGDGAEQVAKEVTMGGTSGLQVRLGFDSAWTDQVIDTPRPDVTLARIDGPGEGQAGGTLPLSSLYLQFSPGKQDDVGFRWGPFLSYHNASTTREKDGYTMQTDIHLWGGGLAFSYGPLLDSTLGSFWKRLLTWGGLDIALGGVQASVGVALGHVSMGVTRPASNDPAVAGESHERASHITAALTPFYFEVEAKLLYMKWRQWQAHLGLNQFFYTEEGGIELRNERAGDLDLRKKLETVVTLERRF